MEIKPQVLPYTSVTNKFYLGKCKSQTARSLRSTKWDNYGNCMLNAIDLRSICYCLL